MKEKLHHLLDLALEIQMRGYGDRHFPYAEISFSNFGSEVDVFIILDGFRCGDYDLFLSFNRNDELAMNAAELALKEALEIAVEKECIPCT